MSAHNLIAIGAGGSASNQKLAQPVSVPGLNSYTSLNRAMRIKDMAKIVEDNKLMLQKLQTASSFYSIG